MKTTDFAKSIDGLPKKERMAILEVIDLKTTSDMKEFIGELRTLKWLVGISVTIIIALLTVLLTK